MRRSATRALQRGLVAQHKAYIESDRMLFEIYGAFVYWLIRWPRGRTSPTDTNRLLPVFSALKLFFLLRHITSFLFHYDIFFFFFCQCSKLLLLIRSARLCVTVQKVHNPKTRHRIISFLGESDGNLAELLNNCTGQMWGW